MTQLELDIYRRIYRVAQELRGGFGPMIPKVIAPGMVERGIVANRLVREITEWIDLHEEQQKGDMDDE